MKLKIINQALDGKLTVKEATTVLLLSEGQVKRLKKGVLTEGLPYVVYTNRNRCYSSR